jgi:hypothetical protein
MASSASDQSEFPRRWEREPEEWDVESYESESRAAGWSRAAIEAERQATIAHLSRWMTAWRRASRNYPHEAPPSMWRIRTGAYTAGGHSLRRRHRSRIAVATR